MKKEIIEYFKLDGSDNTFFKIDGIPDRYSMNKKGLIQDAKFNRLIYPFFINKLLVYRLHINQKQVSIDINRLYLMTFSPMYISLEKYMSKLKVVKLKEDTYYPRTDNLLWLVPEGGVETDKFPGYYGVPGNSNIVVNKKYEIMRCSDRVKINIFTPSHERNYPSVSYKSDNNHFATRQAHRLFALAFIPIPLNFSDKIVVNHKDGNKFNYNVDNLEWVTYRENNIHAFKTGLRSDSHPIFAINMQTGEVKEFYSKAQCGKYLNLHPHTVTLAEKYYRKHKRMKLYPWHITYTKESISTIEKRGFVQAAKNERFFYKVIDSNDNINWCFGRTPLSKAVKVHRKKLPIGNFNLNGYKVERYSRYQVPEEVKALYPENEGRGGKLPIPIKVTDLNTGKSTHYSSVDDFSKIVSMRRKSIQKIVHFRKGLWKHYKIEYLN